MVNEILYTDCKLLEQMAADDHSAFETLYRRYWAPLYDAAYQRLKEQPQAEDIVQEIFVNLWKRRSDLQVENLAAYLHTAVRNRVLNYIVRNKAPESFYEPLAAILLESTTADTVLLQKELLELLKAYIETLPEKRKQIFVLHLYQQLSTKEIADKLQISQKTVQNQLRTAMAELKIKITPLVIAFLSTRL